jgi:succinate dehydrogenase / fumarate reductase cytochrome b subunit
MSSLLRSTLFKKAVMAVTGLMLFGFVLGHMAGNLKAYQGAESFNNYAEFLREVGYPLVPHTALLWVARIGLLIAVGLHIWAATSLTLANRRARPIDYRNRRPVEMDYASRTMRYSGYLLFFYIIYHLLHLTIGSVHSDFIKGDAYHNLVVGLSNPLIAGVYIVANILLGFHLYHGLWSLFQSLGVTHPAVENLRRPFAVVFSAIVTLGFLAAPIGVLSGILTI